MGLERRAPPHLSVAESRLRFFVVRVRHRPLSVAL
jgi:hypothetical protein